MVAHCVGKHPGTAGNSGPHRALWVEARVLQQSVESDLAAVALGTQREEYSEDPNSASPKGQEKLQ